MFHVAMLCSVCLFACRDLGYRGPSARAPSFVSAPTDPATRPSRPSRARFVQSRRRVVLAVETHVPLGKAGSPGVEALYVT